MITPQMLVALPDLCFAISSTVIVCALFLPRCFAIAASTPAGRLAGESIFSALSVRQCPLRSEAHGAPRSTRLFPFEMRNGVHGKTNLILVL